MAKMIQKLSKETKRLQKFEKLSKRYGYLLDLPISELPEKHKAKFGGNLRCFQRIYPRDKEGNKIYDESKVRCKNSTVRGSFFCKIHGGGNSFALKHGRHSVSTITGGVYGRGMPVEFGDLLEKFINDPNIADLRPELAALRLALSKYLEELTSEETKLPPKMLIKQIRSIARNKMISQSERFVMIRDICASQSFITDGDAIDRLNKTVETIAKVTERMHRIQSQDNYILTPDGLKIFLRAIVTVLKTNINDSKVLNEIKEKLMEIHTRTEGNLYKVKGIDDAEFRKVE